MSDIRNIEELKKRKEQLLLEQEVARLERKQNLGKAADGWSWKWVAPLTAVATYFFLGGLAEGAAFPIFLGLGGLVPVALKVYFKRGK